MAPQNKIEQLQTTVKEVTTEVTEVKSLEDEILKKTRAEAAVLKAETLLKQITTTKEAVSQKLESLKGKTDAQSLEEISQLQKEIAQLEEMLQTLESSETDLTELKNGITVTDAKTGVDNVQENNDKKPEQKKSSDEKWWFKKQIDGFSDTTEENHTWKNVGRVAMGVGAGVLIYKWIKWLFGGGKKKEKKESKDGDWEEKGFWQKPFGKFLKRTGIGTWAYYLIHGVTTGKWGLKDFFDWDKRNETNPESINDRYEKNVEAALKPKYEKFGNTVDDFRKWIWNTDSLWIMQNEKHEDIVMPKWAIPAMLDNSYDNVWTILSNDYITDKWKDTGGQLRDTVKSLWGKAVGYLIKPMVWAIKWLTNKMFGNDGEPNEEFQKWAQTPDATRDEQIGNLMTKYAMVRRYLNDKQEQLARKYAIQELAHKNITNPSEEEIQDSLEENKDNINERIETNFRNKKIATMKAGDSIVDTLEWEKIYDNSASETSLAIAAEVQKRKDEIVPDKTIREKAKNSPDINKDDALLTELGWVSNRFWAYLKKWLLHRNILEKMANCRWILNLDELWNGKNDDLEQVMESLHIDTKVKECKKINNEFMEKIRKKTLTKEDVANFEKTIDDYFNKEHTILQDLETKNKEDWDRWFWEKAGIWIGDRLYKLTHTVTWLVIMVTWFGYARFKWVRKVVNGVVSVPLTVFKGVAVKPIFRNINVSEKFGMNKRMKLKVYWEDTKFYGKFLNDFKKGKISWSTAADVFDVRREKWWATGTSFNETLVQKLNLRKIWNLEAIDQASLIKQYCDSDNIRSIMRKNQALDFSDLAAKLNKYDMKIASLSWDSKLFCKTLFENASFKNLDEIDSIVRNMDNIDVTWLSTKQLKKLAEELGKDVSILGDAAKVTAKIDEIKKTVSTVNNVTEVLDQVKVTELHKLIDSEISTLKGKISPNTPNVRKNYYNETIEMLTELKGKTQLLTSGELDSLLRLSANGFDVSNLAKLYKMSKINVIWADMLEEALQKGDINDIVRVLDIARNDASYTKIIKKWDIDEVITTLKKIDPKVIAECGSDIANVCKKAVKLFTKLT